MRPLHPPLPSRGSSSRLPPLPFHPRALSPPLPSRGSSSRLVAGEREALLSFAEAHDALSHLLAHPAVTCMPPKDWAPLRALLTRAKVCVGIDTGRGGEASVTCILTED